MPRSLIYETSKVQQFRGITAAETLVTLKSPFIRPRLEGAKMLAGPASEAIRADKATVTFTITPSVDGGVRNKTYANMIGYLTVIQYRSDGVVSSTFPSPERDVSGYLVSSMGRIAIDVDVTGVCQVQLRAGFANAGAINVPPALVTIQVHSIMQTLEWEREREGGAVS